MWSFKATLVNCSTSRLARAGLVLYDGGRMKALPCSENMGSDHDSHCGGQWAPGRNKLVPDAVLATACCGLELIGDALRGMILAL